MIPDYPLPEFPIAFQLSTTRRSSSPYPDTRHLSIRVANFLPIAYNAKFIIVIIGHAKSFYQSSRLSSNRLKPDYPTIVHNPDLVNPDYQSPQFPFTFQSSTTQGSSSYYRLSSNRQQPEHHHRKPEHLTFIHQSCRFS